MSLDNYKPINAYILVELDEHQKTNEGLISTSKEITTGTVISVGDGTPGWPKMKSEPGQRIKWHRHSGERIKVQGKSCIILNEEKREVQGII